MCLHPASRVFKIHVSQKYKNRLPKCPIPFTVYLLLFSISTASKCPKYYLRYRAPAPNGGATVLTNGCTQHYPNKIQRVCRNHSSAACTSFIIHPHLFLRRQQQIQYVLVCFASPRPFVCSGFAFNFHTQGFNDGSSMGSWNHSTKYFNKLTVMITS